MNTKIKKLIAGLMVAGVIGGGAFLVLGPEQPASLPPITELETRLRSLTIQERDEIIEQYNNKLVTIRQNCDTDIRCIERDGKRLVNFGVVKSRIEALEKLNQWVLDGELPKYRK